MSDRRRERIARNESVFRDLNEDLEQRVHRGRPPDHPPGFVCECGDPDCEATVRIDLADYEAIRRSPMLFFVVPGHQSPQVEDVIDEHEGYLVVRKHEDVRDVVEQTDPRGGDET